MDVTEKLGVLFTERYGEFVSRYKSRAGENDVEDMVQEAFYRALLYKDSFNPTYISLGGWLTSILNNCLNALLNEKKDGKMMHDSEKEPTIDDRCPSDVEIERKILKDIEDKRGETKQILWLYFVMGSKPKDIHKIVGGSEIGVRVACKRFKQACSEKYGHLMRE